MGMLVVMMMMELEAYLGEGDGDGGLHGQLVRQVYKLLLLFLHSVQEVTDLRLCQ